MYYNEDHILDLRLNYLNKFIDHFVIVESIYNHKGEKKGLNFDMKNYQKFKDKIIYIVVDKLPDTLKINDDDNEDTKNEKYILNGYKRDHFQRNQITEGIKTANEDDLILISDLDEIPNLSGIKLKDINDNFVFFKQDMMYYKFNLRLENYTWIGSKACKMKNLESPQWIRDIKDRKYNWWRVDTYFSKRKYSNILFVENGGWHFSYLKKPKDIEKKLKSYLHHIDYDMNPVGEKGIQEMINNKKTIYNIKADQKENKFDGSNKLNKININLLPSYILENKDKLKDWIEE